MNGHAIKQLAQAVATVAHDGVSRKGAGEPYINHPERVAASPRLWGWRQLSLAWLHDVIEDAPSPRKMEEALRQLFPADMVDDLMLLSRLPHSWLDGKPLLGAPGSRAEAERVEQLKEPYQQWIERIAANGPLDVALVKLADLEDNLHDLRDLPPEMRSRERRYLRAKATLLDRLER